MNHYLWVLVSSIIIYLFIIIAIRLFGKKELAQLSVTDLVFILLISNAVQNAMVAGDNSLQGGLIAASSLFILNFILKLLIYRFPKFSKAVQGDHIMLIYNGVLNKANLVKARVTVGELEEAAREHGVGSLAEVNLAVLEMDGNISILSDEFTSRTKRKRKHFRDII